MYHYETERNSIDYFREEYWFLSNFYPARVLFDGITYYSSEAAYQAQKCAAPADRLQFAALSADESKRFGGKSAISSDWEQIKLSVMKKIVRAKFTQNPYLARYLVETGNKILKEGNTWGDVYWGIDLKTGDGENHLGKILMELRSEFQENGIPDTDISFDRQLFGSPTGISVVLDDITQSDCECIVNAAHSTLLDSDGIDSSLRIAAGKELSEACSLLCGCPVGEAKITKGYRLKAEYIIHTVGPRYGTENDEALLIQTYKNILTLAKENNIHSIAVPAISVGKFSYPKKAAVQIAVLSSADWIKNNDYPINIEFTCWDFRMYKLFCEQIKALQ